MKLYLLKAIEGCDDFEPWYDKAFGHLIRAENAAKARALAAAFSGDEGDEVWLNYSKTTCVNIDLMIHGEEEHLMIDQRMA